MAALPENFILIDKPSGMTSFDVIRQLRKRTGIKKWGHAGTLDPAATGLMILAKESGTKLLADYIKLDKEYVAEILIGERRTTGDMEGEVIESVGEVTCTDDEIREAVQSLVGTLTLPVSAYSAIKKDGVPMYKRARKAEQRGETVEDVPWREMVVHEAELLTTELVIIDDNKRVIVTVRFKVGSGTYIRSLAEELGRRLARTPTLTLFTAATLSVCAKLLKSVGLTSLSLFFYKLKLRQCRCRGIGYPATLKNLRRTKVGEFDIKDAEKLENF